jgi:hypothetical protein
MLSSVSTVFLKTCLRNDPVLRNLYLKLRGTIPEAFLFKPILIPPVINFCRLMLKSLLSTKTVCYNEKTNPVMHALCSNDRSFLY